MTDSIQLHKGDCIEGMRGIADGSIDAIVSDPPYLYLDHILDKEFDEQVFFQECNRVLKDGGLIVLFGRGTSFYRWNTTLANMGFTFKEEIVWDKANISSPVHVLGRRHETISIHAKGKGKIRACRVPYMEVNINSPHKVERDINKIMSVLGDDERISRMKDLLKTGKQSYERKRSPSITVGGTKDGRSEGRTKDGRSEESTMNTIINGYKESSVIQINSRSFRESGHPTEKPVRLMERLICLVSDKNDVILDPFAGSASTGIACVKTDRKFIGFEIDDEYFSMASERIQRALREKQEKTLQMFDEEEV
jgi:site-specific DNA-methyltransferase (adenine-specific)